MHDAADAAADAASIRECGSQTGSDFGMNDQWRFASPRASSERAKRQKKRKKNGVEVWTWQERRVPPLVRVGLAGVIVSWG